MAPTALTRLDAVTDAARTAAPHVVIVGAGFGGLACAQALGGTGIRVTLIDRNNYHLFQPLLYQVATAGLAATAIARPIRNILRRHPNIRVLLAEVTAVDPAVGQLVLGTERLGYDWLVLATGATHSYFGHPEWAPLAPGLKTLEDARLIRARLLMNFEQAEMTLDPLERRRLMTTVVVGGGPTGVEMAGAIAELTRFTLVRDFRNIRPQEATILIAEGGPRLLPQFPESLSHYAERALRRMGVIVRTGAMVTEVDRRGVTVAGDRVPTPLAIWGAGVAASPTVGWLGAPTDRAGRVRVGLDLAVPGLERVFVLGDCALVEDPETGKPLPGLAQVAQQQGRYLGQSLRARIAGQSTTPPFRFRNRGNLATIGRNLAVADFGKTRFTGFFAWLLWSAVHVYLLVGFEKRLVVALEWLWAYLTYQRGARIITRDAVPANPAATIDPPHPP